MQRKNQKRPAEPVTIVFSWEVLSGKEVEFTEWIHGITKTALRWPGHMGVTTLRPPSGRGTYHSVLRFDTSQHLKDWLDSEERSEWISQLTGIATVANSNKASGLETWFDISGASITPPPKWKMALVTFIAVYPLSLILGEYVSPHILSVNIFIRALLFPIVVPLVLTYFSMPFLTRHVFKGWLYKTQKYTEAQRR